MTDNDDMDAIQRLHHEAVRNSIWASRPVSQEPSITLINWWIIEISGTRHCVGYNEAWPEGRVSSPITAFDPATRRAVTETGRVYHLNGEPGWDADAAYVLAVWLHVNGFAPADVIDITELAVNSPMSSSEMDADSPE